MPTFPNSVEPRANMIVRGAQQFPSSTPFSSMVLSKLTFWTLHTAAAQALEASVKEVVTKVIRRMVNEWKGIAQPRGSE